MEARLGPERAGRAEEPFGSFAGTWPACQPPPLERVFLKTSRSVLRCLSAVPPQSALRRKISQHVCLCVDLKR